MTELFIQALEMGLTKESATWAPVITGALMGGGVGGVAGALNSDPGARMRGFMRGAAVGAGAGALGGGVMRHRAMGQMVESGAHKGLTRQNFGQAMKNPEAYKAATGGGEAAYKGAVQGFDNAIIKGDNLANTGMMLGAAGFGGAMLGGARNPYYGYGYGYPSYGY